MDLQSIGSSPMLVGPTAHGEAARPKVLIDRLSRATDWEGGHESPASIARNRSADRWAASASPGSTGAAWGFTLSAE
jgi:hypothetical protein